MEMTLSRLGITNVKVTAWRLCHADRHPDAGGDDGIAIAGLSAGYVLCNEHFIVTADPYGGHAYAPAA